MENLDEVLVEPMDNAEDIANAFNCACEAFGKQTNDAIWTGMNPGWDTVEGKARGANRLVERWCSTTTNNQGNPNTIFLKATAPDPQHTGQRTIAGMAIWAQLSNVEGHGTKPTDDVSAELAALYPDNNEQQRRFVAQMFRSLVKRRLETVAEKTTETPPAVLVLDLCAVNPAFQRRGVGARLVRWGLEEAERRGLECTTEASRMGRHVYARLGFRVGPEIEYAVDAEFAGREMPSNVFMRTGSGRL